MESPTTEIRRPPATRYQGSKYKLLADLAAQFEMLEFETALDAFSGTASVAYLLKSLGKQVTCNDYLRCNQLTAHAIVENSNTRFEESRIAELFTRRPDVAYEDFIERTFEGIYFTTEENRLLDVIAQNLATVGNRSEQALAYHALFQACIAKRPYNLFHRRNLYMRTADVKRSFGNKATWDTPLEIHFQRNVATTNAAIFDNGHHCAALCDEVLQVEGEFDLVYIDSPYINARGTGVDYRDFYHFLEGLTDYAAWPSKIDQRRKHRPLLREPSPWTDPQAIHQAFDDLFARFADSILVVSYRSDGIPSIAELVGLLKRYKRDVEEIPLGRYQYVLSKNGKSQEVVLIAK